MRPRPSSPHFLAAGRAHPTGMAPPGALAVETLESHLDSVVRRSRDELNGPAPPPRPAGPPAAARDRVPRRPYDARDALPFARAVGSRETERFALYAARFPARAHGVRHIWGIRYAAPIRDLQVRHPLPRLQTSPARGGRQADRSAERLEDRRSRAAPTCELRPARLPLPRARWGARRA